ncbi:MAG: beta-lactamase family protein [Lentisphaeria bacterium]|nr:beta-lactamase family protein [Lentisphaeria bacterium]
MSTHVFALLKNAVSDQAFPGAALAVGSSSGLSYTLCHGHHEYACTRRVRADHLFDLASLTKVVSSTSLAMRLHDTGHLDLDARVIDLLPAFLEGMDGSPERAQVTIRHLLAHCSGLPAGRRFDLGAPVSAPERLDTVCKSPLRCAPGTETVYSDIGAIVLGALLEQIGDAPLDALFEREVCAPLGLTRTLFRPTSIPLAEIVPTECSAAREGRAWHGDVHDENARWLGGVAGHAGLFSTALDLARFCQDLLTCRLGGTGRLASAETARLFTHRAELVAESSRCLGWDSPSSGCSGGHLLGAHSFGHTGFTGTSLWLDPDADLYVVLLTNAVHPRRERRRHGFFAWRRRIHTAVYKARGYGSAR